MSYPTHAVEVQVHLARALSAGFMRWLERVWRLPMVRIPAVRAGAVHRPGRENAAVVDLAAQRADDRNAGQIPLLREFPHLVERSPSCSVCTRGSVPAA
jgi:hypothetical protein